jgi:hypothetical protein
MLMRDDLGPPGRASSPSRGIRASRQLRAALEARAERVRHWTEDMVGGARWQSVGPHSGQSLQAIHINKFTSSQRSLAGPCFGPLQLPSSARPLNSPLCSSTRPPAQHRPTDVWHTRKSARPYSSLQHERPEVEYNKMHALKIIITLLAVQELFVEAQLGQEHQDDGQPAARDADSGSQRRLGLDSGHDVIQGAYNVLTGRL